MKRALLEIVRCPECAAFPLACAAFDEEPDGEVANGVVWCRSCTSWYPVEDRLLELLQRSLAYREDRACFWRRHEARLVELGLTAPDELSSSEDVAEQRHQQEHFDWYGDNDRQTYAAYEQMRFWKIVDGRAFRMWSSEMKPGGVLLDVGCAQGRSTFRVSAPDLTIIGFDVSKRLVRQAVERARGRRSMSFFVADATRMPIVDASVDYVLIYGVLHHLPKPDRICGEAGRVLKTGGALFCSENNDSIFHPIFDWLQRISPIWYEEAGEHSHIQTGELQAWLEQAGFRPRVWSGVFVPPHLVNLLPPRVGGGLVALTDRAFGSVPWFCDQGGLIFSTSIKSAR